MSYAVVASPEEPPRVAFAVGRNVGSAVVRNRVRRRLRSAVREHATLLTPGCGYLVRASAQAANATYRELSESLAGAFGAKSSKATP